MEEIRIAGDSLSANRAEILFLHGRRADRTSAFLCSEKCAVMLKIPRSLGARHVVFEIFDESKQTLCHEISAEWNGFTGEFDRYLVKIPKISPSLLFGRIHAETLYGEVYSVGEDRHVTFVCYPTSPDIQISFSDFRYSAPSAILGGIIYHVFVDRFAKGTKTYATRPGTVINPDWNNGIPEFPDYPGAPLKNNVFFGGTLDGVREKLPYLSSLGVSAIYLSPIFESPSNHKYDTSDYMTVDSMFGGEKALGALISDAKAQGIGIILDGVFNHTGSDSRYFNKKGTYPTIDAYQSEESPYYSWYDFAEYPDRYTCWWDIDILPRIHPDRQGCGEYFVGENGVIRKYGKLGILGFRLDVADELSDDFLSKIKSALAETAKGSVLYGEVWEDASNKIAYGTRKKYYLGAELDGVMNYPVRRGLVSFLRNGETADLRYALETVVNHTPRRILNAEMNLIGTHDTERILTVLAGESSEGHTNAELSRMHLSSAERERGRKLVSLGYTALATLPGVPSIYYGDEVGIEGYRDPFNRMPFPWENMDEIILSHYRKVGEIRRKNDVYRDGDFKLILLEPGLLIFGRFRDGKCFLTVLNRREEALALSFSFSATDLFSGKRGRAFRLSPLESKIFETKSKTTFSIE